MLLAGTPATNYCSGCGCQLFSSPVPGGSNNVHTTLVPSESLRMVRKGLWIVIMCMLCCIPIGLVRGVMGLLAQNGVLSMQGVQFLNMFIGLPITIISLWGYWLATEEDQSRVAPAEYEAARRSARTWLLVQITFGTIAFIANITVLTLWPPDFKDPMAMFKGPTLLVMLFVGIPSAAVGLIQFITFMQYIRALASRIPDGDVVHRADMYLWFVPLLSTVGILACGIGPLLAAVLYWLLLSRVRKHVASIVATGRPAMLPKMGMFA